MSRAAMFFSASLLVSLVVWSLAFVQVAPDAGTCSVRDPVPAVDISAEARSLDIDEDAPVVTASVSGVEGGGGWLISPAVVTVDVVDSGSGANLTEYRVVGSSDWTEYESPVEFDLDGVWLFEARSTDYAGNTGEDSVSFKVDLTAPVTSSAAEGPVVNLTAADPASGVSETWYRIDGGDWVLYGGPFEVVGEGGHTLEYWSVDVAGNQEEVEDRDVEVIRTETAFSLDWWMVVLIGVLLIMISVGAVFGMRRKAKESDARSAIKDMGSPMAQLMDDNPAARPGESPPSDAGPQKPK